MKFKSIWKNNIKDDLYGTSIRDMGLHMILLSLIVLLFTVFVILYLNTNNWLFVIVPLILVWFLIVAGWINITKI